MYCKQATCFNLAPCALHRSLFTFGSHVPFGSTAMIEASQVLLRNPAGTAFGFSSPRPIVPGHAIVIPRRQVQRLSELADEEFVDFLTALRATQALIEPPVGATACNIAIRDGADAGMPVDHIHAHLVPRKPHDFEENDSIYGELANWSPFPGEVNHAPAFPVPERRPPRSQKEMADEAAGYHAALLPEAKGSELDGKEQPFGRFSLEASQLFFISASGLSAACVNLKPLCPGHVLVIPRRGGLVRMSELSAEEYLDLFRSVRVVAELVERVHGCRACVVAVDRKSVV